MLKRKIPHLDWIPMLFIAFILYRLVNNVESFVEGIKFFLSIISYITWGFAIAYLLNPGVTFLEDKLKANRLISMLVVYIVFIGVIIFFTMIIIPNVIVKNVRELLETIPKYLISTRDWLNDFVTSSDFIDEIDIENFFVSLISNITERTNQFIELSTEIIKNMVNLTSAIIKFIVGSMISIYLLKDKDYLIKSVKKFTFTVFRKETAEIVVDVARKVNQKFSRFLIGKALDSLIIGIMCFIGLLLLDVRYALLISLLVGVTNMIPYFGPIFGAVPGVILTLFYDPTKAFWVLVFLLLLQQFDGWILGPKILGDSVGLKPFWIIVGILVGGGLFGVIGMLLGVPCAAVISMFLGEYMDKKLKSRNIIIK